MYCIFFTATSTSETYTLSLHDALPICPGNHAAPLQRRLGDALRLQHGRWETRRGRGSNESGGGIPRQRGEGRCCKSLERSEEHTSELQSRQYLVCRLLLEKKKHTGPLH